MNILSPPPRAIITLLRMTTATIAHMYKNTVRLPHTPFYLCAMVCSHDIRSHAMQCVPMLLHRVVSSSTALSTNDSDNRLIISDTHKQF